MSKKNFKMALVVESYPVFDMGLDRQKLNDLLNSDLSFGLMDRKFCETDQNYLQLIPYITLWDSANNKFFVYTRGDVGDENRLHGMCSLGLGGHIDYILPLVEEATYNDILYNTIVSTAIRELSEEVGAFEVETIGTNHQLAETEANRVMFDKLMRAISNATLIHTDLDEVGSVHLGISIVCPIDPSTLGEHENGVIIKGQWLSMEEIKTRTQLDEGNEERLTLETWSEILIQTLETTVADIALQDESSKIVDDEVEDGLKTVVEGMDEESDSACDPVQPVDIV